MDRHFLVQGGQAKSMMPGTELRKALMSITGSGRESSSES
jgi:hypothetical protein